MPAPPRPRGRARLFAALLLLSAAFAGKARAINPAPRYAQAVALMPNGKVLVAGGIDNSGNPTTSVEILDTTRGSEFVPTNPAVPPVQPEAVSAAAPLNFARSSATITVLPNGYILVTGGWSGAAARQDAEVYNPATNVWTLATNAMSSGRFNHTATLLNTGNVLVCGGQVGGVVTATCDLFAPSGASGSFSPTGSLRQARALHTATILGDGTVWAAGGWNPGLPNQYLVTTERYNPNTGQWSSADVLNIERALHTATLDGDGKVLVAGGYNAKSIADPTGFGATYGNLNSSELFDPAGGAVVPGPPLQMAVQTHAATLRPEGTVSAYGGIGNIPTTPFTQTPTFDYGSSVTAAGGGYGTAPLTFNLGAQVTGTIMDGDIEFIQPSLKFLPSGLNVTLNQTLTELTSPNTAVGLRIPLNGVEVGCTSNGGSQTCGVISGDFGFSNMGQSSFDVSGSQNAQVANQVTNNVFGQLLFTPATISTTIPTGAITGGHFYTEVRVSVPSYLAGRYLTSVTLTLTPSYTAVWSELNGYQVVMTGGSGTAPGAVGTPGYSAGTGVGGSYPVQSDGKGGYYIDISSFTFNNIQGSIQITAPAPESPYTLNTGVGIPVGGPTTMTSLSASMDFTTDGVGLCSGVGSCATLNYQYAYVVVRKMVFGDTQFFTPKQNSWTFQPPNGTIARPGMVTTGASAIVMPNGDEFDIGGRTVTVGALTDVTGLPAVTGLVPAFNGAQRLDEAVVWAPQGTVSSQGDLMAHAFHTASLLPDGTILLAGGTDGVNILQSAEIFNPVGGTFAMTASSMSVTREHHSASLLPNGRVLIAGGFTSTAAYSGPTKSADLYFYNTHLFLPAAVMLSSHSQHVAVNLPNGNVFVAGGYDSPTTVGSTAEIYQSTTNTWIPAANMPAAQERAVAAAVQLQDGTIMVCGGVNETGILSSVLNYNPATNVWTTDLTDPMPSPLQSHTATLLPDGRVLVAGGDDGYGETTSSFLFDPQAAAGSRWSYASPLNTPRFGHSATLLPNGTVMISGGVYEAGLNGNSLANARTAIEFFHTDVDAWTNTTSLLAPRAFHTATLAPNGSVYFLGGANGAISTPPPFFYQTYESMYFTMAPEEFSVNSSGQRQSTISSITAVPSGAPSPFQPSTAIEVKGLQFRGATEAAGGAAGPGNPSFNTPRLLLQKFDGSSAGGSGSSPGFVADMTQSIYSYAGVPNNLATLNTDLKVTLPIVSSVPYGWYMAWVAANDIHTALAPMIQIGPALPGAVANLSATPVGISSVTYTWTSPGGTFDGYEVYSATTGVFIATVSAATPTYTQVNLAPNTTAEIMVAAYSMSGDGALTNSATVYTLAAAPNGISFASVTFDTLWLQWNSNGNTNGTVYEVYQSTDGFVSSFSTPVPTSLGLTATGYLISALATSTTYYFRLRAFNTAGVASLSYSVVASTQTRGTVSGVNCGSLNSGDTPTSIQWSWTPGAPISYNVYNATTGARLGSVPGSVSTFHDTGLAIDSPRSIMVSAVTGAGESPLTPSGTCYTLAAPPAAGSPVMTSTEPTSIYLQWTANGNPQNTPYAVTYTHAVSSTFAAVVTATTTAFSNYFGGLSPSAPYAVSIVAINGSGVASTPLSAGTTFTLANPPAGLSVLGTTPASISVSWSQNSNSTMTFYQLEYSKDNFAADDHVAVPYSAKFALSSTTIPGLLTGTTYWIRIQAQNPYGHLTSYGNIVSTVTYNGGAPPGSLAGVLTGLGASNFTGSLGDGTIFTMYSPGGAFPADTTVTISTYDTSANDHGPLCPNGIVNPFGGQATTFVITDSPSYQPTRPVLLTASYTPAQITGPVSQVSLSRYDGPGACTPLKTSFNTATQTFMAQLNHFSTYQLVQVPLATSVSGARVFPNPYRAASDGYITFDQIPPQSRVRVMTLRGETVLDATADGTGLLTWNASNGSGRPVASGLYLVVVESGGTSKLLKLAVVR